MFGGSPWPIGQLIGSTIGNSAVQISAQTETFFANLLFRCENENETKMNICWLNSLVKYIFYIEFMLNKSKKKKKFEFLTSRGNKPFSILQEHHFNHCNDDVYNNCLLGKNIKKRPRLGPK